MQSVHQGVEDWPCCLLSLSEVLVSLSNPPSRPASLNTGSRSPPLLPSGSPRIGNHLESLEGFSDITLTTVQGKLLCNIIVCQWLLWFFLWLFRPIHLVSLSGCPLKCLHSHLSPSLFSPSLSLSHYSQFFFFPFLSTSLKFLLDERN